MYSVHVTPGRSSSSERKKNSGDMDSEIRAYGGRRKESISVKLKNYIRSQFQSDSISVKFPLNRHHRELSKIVALARWENDVRHAFPTNPPVLQCDIGASVATSNSSSSNSSQRTSIPLAQHPQLLCDLALSPCVSGVPREAYLGMRRADQWWWNRIPIIPSCRQYIEEKSSRKCRAGLLADEGA